MKLKMNRKTLNSIAIGIMALLTVLMLILGGFLRLDTAGAETELEVTDIDSDEIGLNEEIEPAEDTSYESEDEPDESYEEPADPTEAPIEDPMEAPTEEPTEAPTEEPATEPAEEPTEEPTTEPTDTPVQPTPVIMDQLFKIEIVAPKNWTNDKTRKVRVKVWQLTDETWARAQYKLDNGDWAVIKEKFTLLDGYYYVDLELTDNCLLTVRLNIESGVFMDEKKEIRIFDRTAPIVTAGFNDTLLHVEALDDLSGTAGAQVNGLLFTTLENGKLDVRMEDVLLTYKQLAIRAYDYAGNFSDPVVLDNPYYVSVTPTPKPTQKPTAKPTEKPTTKPTKKPTSTSTATEEPEATREPVTVATATPVPENTQYPYPYQVPYQTAEPVVIVITPEPVVTPEPEVRTEYVPIGPGQPFTSGGNMQTLDVLYSAATNKQFITVQSRNGQTYYLVIDYDKPIDEENELYETYFLNLVDDRDLMSVLSEEEIVPTPTPEIIYVTPEPTSMPLPTSPPTAEPEKPEKQGMNQTSLLALLVLLLAGGGAAFFFMKKKKGNVPANRMLDESSFDDDEDEEEEESDEEDGGNE